MSEEHSPGIEAPTVAVPAPGPAVEIPAPAPAAVEIPAAAPDPIPSEPAAVPEAPAAKPEEPGFLSIGEPPKPEGEKPAEEPKVEDEPAVPIEEEIKYEFTLPEGMQLDPERVEPLTRWLNEHKIPGEKAQELLDLHLDTVKAVAEHLAAEQWRTFEEHKVTKRNEIMSDPVIGGAGFKTSQAAALRAINLFTVGWPKEDRIELGRRLDASAMADDVYLARLFVAAARRFDEPAPPPPNAAPLAPREAAGKPPRGQSSIYKYPRGSRAG